MNSKMIQPMDYVVVVNDKKLKGSGLERGQLLMVAALKPAPVKKSDPYLQRVYTLCVKIGEDGTHEIPNDNNEYSQYIIDPRNVEKVSDEQQQELYKCLEKQYGN